MDGDDEVNVDEESIVTRRPRVAFIDGKAVRRLYRELGGGDLFSDPRRNHGAYRPAEMCPRSPDKDDMAFWGTPASNRTLKMVRISSLIGQQKLRKYIILGEKPTVPHHLVTILRPHERTLDGTPSYSSSEDGLGGSVAYWELDKAAGSINEVSFVDYYQNSSRMYEYFISSAYTAWDIERDMLAQVLVWDYKEDEIEHGIYVVYQKIEFRYGGQSCVIDHIDPGRCAQMEMGVCFSGLPGDQDGVAIRALFPRRLFFYEPFGGRKHCSQENSSWKIAPEILQLVKDPAYTESNLYMPRVTIVELDDIAARHLKAVLKTYESSNPAFSFCYSTFIQTRRPSRFSPGERQRFDRKCTVAFGAAESRSRMYHLFIISLDPYTRQHKIHVAKALSSSVVFDWENMVNCEPSALFYQALARVVGPRKLTHDCGVDCAGFLEDSVRVLYKFTKEPVPVKVIRMQESGIALTGWSLNTPDRMALEAHEAAGSGGD